MGNIYLLFLGGEGAWGTPYTSDILDIDYVNGASTTTTQALPSWNKNSPLIISPPLQNKGPCVHLVCLHNRERVSREHLLKGTA